MDNGKTLYVTNREGFRNWLEKNGASETEIWLVTFKGGSEAQTLTYEQAIKEAICFGWAEADMKTIDEEKYAQRFTPRQADAKWTQKDLEHARALVSGGRMTEAGLATLPEDLNTKVSKSKKE
jgi:uncharacterized protein YdeI (YjbR/CyaY-like superfamily)